MRMKNLKRSVGIFLYDRQLGGRKFAAAKKSLQEVFRTLQAERNSKGS